ncbi:MAG: low molecular weight protein-tyrosine-phosphatase [Pseudomonadota bacterium]|nr:low molecular weight protein-tyrosine-phosphatase [Pseudomonadota bacterium]
MVLVKVLFICLGNICRSPTAEGVFRKHIKNENLNHKIKIDSVGTGSWHVGNPPDKRSQEVATLRGYDISNQRSRQINNRDIEESDYLIAMDTNNISTLQELIPEEMKKKLFLFLEFAPQLEQLDVPDPYYSGPDGFDLVIDLIEAASEGLLAHIKDTDF